MPGKLLHNLHNVGRVVGGMNPETAAAMAALYRHVVKAELVQTDCLTAELVKTVENAYRDVQIAFANEVALICEAVGGDVWQVRELVNKSPYRAMHLPGAGVGGHCIPKDPWLLAYSVQGKDIPLRLIPAARAINESMPMHMAELTIQALAQTGKNLSGAHVLLMGYAYLEDSGDTRNSPSAALAERLQQLGATVAIHDPYVAEYANDLLQVASGCDAAIVMVRHREYLKLDLQTLKSVMHTPVMVDGRLVYNGATMQAQGWIYRAVGQAVDTLASSDL
jgi:UDP-N-acetyl-D-mannosaminuronic acid dehydrogenase